MPEYMFIVNPISGRGEGIKSLPDISRLAEQYSMSYEIETTQYPLHAVELSERAANRGIPIVIAVGGDGTANEVLNGLMSARQRGGVETSLGIMCVGRGNDFAYSLGIPKGVEEGFQVILNNKTRSVDTGFVRGGDFPEGRYFGNGVGIGFDTIVGFEALKMTRLHGFLSYIVAAVKTIYLYNDAPRLHIQSNDFEITRNILMLSIMNGCRMGGGFLMAPDARNDDGLFDLCIANQVSRIQILGLILRFMSGAQAGHPAIAFQRSSSIEVTALEGVLPVHADGETICYAGKRLTLEIVPSSLKVLSP